MNNISNNISATTTRCVHGSWAWTGRNLIVDEGLKEKKEGEGRCWGFEGLSRRKCMTEQH